MKYLNDFSDNRNKIFCPYCGKTTELRNRDHVPSKVFLDKPYPANLHIIFPCQKCNARYSRDEEYVPCLIECVRADSIDLEHIGSEKVKKILLRNPSIVARLARSVRQFRSGSMSDEDAGRIKNIVHKLGQGHVAYELGEPILSDPASVLFRPLASLSKGQLTRFENTSKFSILGEVGSRVLQRQVQSNTGLVEWNTIQSGRYRYLILFNDIILVRIVIFEFLACEVTWRRL